MVGAILLGHRARRRGGPHRDHQGPRCHTRHLAALRQGRLDGLAKLSEVPPAGPGRLAGLTGIRTAACPASCRVCSRLLRSRPPPFCSRSPRRPTRRSPAVPVPLIHADARRHLTPATAPTTTSRPASPVGRRPTSPFARRVPIDARTTALHLVVTDAAPATTRSTSPAPTSADSPASTATRATTSSSAATTSTRSTPVTATTA